MHGNADQLQQDIWDNKLIDMPQLHPNERFSKVLALDGRRIRQTFTEIYIDLYYTNLATIMKRLNTLQCWIMDISVLFSKRFKKGHTS